MNDYFCELSGLLRDYQDRWQVEHQDAPPAWVAVRHLTPTRIHVLVAHDLAGLRAKLAAAESAAD